MTNSLKERTTKGLFWGGLSNATQQVLNLFFGIFLSRLLDETDYGMVGMLTVFTLIAGSLQESGFTAALANKKNVEHKDYNAVFWFNILVGLALYVLLFCCAPLIASFYRNPELTSLGRVYFLTFLITSCGSAQHAYLFKHLMVKQKAVALTISLLLSGTTGVTLALLGFSYWGLAIQNLVYVSSVSVCYWIFSPWRPTFHFDFSPIRSMFRFSSKVLITNIFTHINNNLFSVLLGRLYSEREVGYFSQANKWNYMGHSFVSGMVNGVAQPVMVSVLDDKDRLCRVFRKMLRFTSFVSFPALLILALVAEELIVITITDKWLESARILQMLCVWGAFIPIIYLFSNLIISLGKSTIYMWNTIVLGLIQLLAVLLVYPWGIQSMIVCYVAINILWLLVWYYFVHKAIGIALFAVLKDILPFLLAAGISVSIAYFATLSIANIYVLFIAKAAIAGGVYLVMMWFSNAVVFMESVELLGKKRRR